MRGSDFAELKALATIVQEGSFSRAAARLRVSRSALSQTVKNLEERLGVLLLNRTTRSVAPTEAAERLLSRFLPALAEMEAAVADAQDLNQKPTGTIRIHAQRLASETFLEPIFAEFAERHPDVTLDVKIDDAVVDIVAGGFDVGIRLGELLDQDMVALPLGGELRQLAVASPSYVAKHGAPTTPKDLHAHRCIAFRWPGADAIYNWEFKKNAKWFSVAVKGPLVVSEQRVAVRAAVAGVGIAFWVESEVRPLIDAGKLLALLEDWSPRFPGFFLYLPRQRHRSRALQAFVDHLRRRSGRRS